MCRVINMLTTITVAVMDMVGVMTRVMAMMKTTAITTND
jgi:hypothetical protein